MKKSIPVRLLTALAGLVLLALAVGVTAEAFFRVEWMALVHQVLESRRPLAVVLTLAAILLLAAMAVACLAMLTPSRPTKKRGFVMQRGENGPIGISIKAIEGLVRSCVDQQEAIAKSDIAIAERRDGVIILVQVDQAAGVNIPLSVGAMQKQIKQYVTACTGVDVQEVRVLVENNAPAMTTSPFTIQETVPSVPAEAINKEVIPATVQEQEAAPAPAPQSTPTVAPVTAAAVMTSVVSVQEEADDRPLHQRLFGAEEQPAIVPMPPEMAGMGEQEQADAPTAEAAVETIPEETAEAAPEVETAESPAEAETLPETEEAPVPAQETEADE